MLALTKIWSFTLMKIPTTLLTSSKLKKKQTSSSWSNCNQGISSQVLLWLNKNLNSSYSDIGLSSIALATQTLLFLSWSCGKNLVRNSWDISWLLLAWVLMRPSKLTASWILPPEKSSKKRFSMSVLCSASMISWLKLTCCKSTTKPKSQQ